MGLTNEALAQEKINFVVWEGDILIARGSALHFLDWINDQGKMIIGAEGFTFDGENFTPLMECIIDHEDEDPFKNIQFYKDIMHSDSDWKHKPHFIDFTIQD